MEIVVYTKPGCALCRNFKDKLLNHLKVPFGERDLAHSLQISDTWKRDSTARLAAAHAYLDSAVPLILIDQRAFTYVRALVEIKKRLAAGEKATMPDPERDTALDKLGPPLTEAVFVAAVWRLCQGHVDFLHVLSPVVRVYDAEDKSVASREVRGELEISVCYRNPNVQPMILEELTVSGQSFREVLRKLSETLEDCKARGVIA